MTKTSCDWTVERLPWWVNGTLEEAEAERVAAHLADCAACREELTATRGALTLYAAHLPVETLLDLVEDGVAESFRGAGGAVMSRQAVDGHLGHCTACRAELSLLRESRATVYADPAAPGATVTAFAPSPRPARHRRRLDRRSVALAASVLLFAVSAGGWLATARTAERRADLLVELERRYSEAVAARTVDERGAEPPATGETPDESAAALAAAAERAAEQEAEIAELEGEIERLRQAGEGGERVASVVGFGPIESWHLGSTVMRGGEERPAAPPVEVPAGAAQFSLVLTGIPDEPLRLVIENPSRQRLDERDLIPYDSPDLGPHVTLTLTLADLPAGELRLRLFAGGEEIGTRLLRVAR